MSTLDDLKIRIVAVIGSEKNGCTANHLYQIYKDMYGRGLHPEEYGFEDLDSLLVSPAMQGEGGIVYENGRYFAAGDKNTKKMLDLVRNTKSKSRNLKTGRRCNAAKSSTSMKREFRPVAPAYSNCIKAESSELPKWFQNEAISIEKTATKFQENSDGTLKNIPQSNLKAKFYKKSVISVTSLVKESNFVIVKPSVTISGLLLMLLTINWFDLLNSSNQFVTKLMSSSS